MAARAPSATPESAAVAESLQALYTGPLAELQPPLVGTVASGCALPGHDLLEPEQLHMLLQRFAGQYRGHDLRAIASQWSKWHFAAVVIPAVATNLLLERDLPVALEDVQLLQTPTGQIQRMVVQHAGRPLTGTAAAERFSTLVDRHLIPLCDTLAAVSGASSRVFASNAGNVFEASVNRLANHPLSGPGATTPAMEWMVRRRTPAGDRNPLYSPVYYHSTDSAEPERVRRLCCIRYLLPELDCCGNCPLVERGRAAKSN